MKMTFMLQTRRRRLSSRLMLWFVLSSFISNTIFLPSIAQAQMPIPVPTVLIGGVTLPQPGHMLAPSISYQPAVMAGLTLNTENPFEFNFIINNGDDKLTGADLETESKKLINYFLASLTVPEDQMWVNLSPYEKDRIIADGLSKTEMGRDMLALDYILKQFTASLMFPEGEQGKKFWERIYATAQNANVDIPTNTFNKVWIVPDQANVYVHEKNVFVVRSHLKVMLEEDYLAAEKAKGIADTGLGKAGENLEPMTPQAAQLIREIILPEIEREVNEGKTFANLRQIYNSMILAAWYKKNLKQSVLTKVYADQNKINGIDIADKNVKDKLYAQYLEAFKKGVYDYIKEDYDPKTQEVISKKYFSGGLKGVSEAMVAEGAPTAGELASLAEKEFSVVKMNARPMGKADAAMTVEELIGNEDLFFTTIKKAARTYSLAQSDQKQMAAYEGIHELIQAAVQRLAEEPQERLLGKLLIRVSTDLMDVEALDLDEQAIKKYKDYRGILLTTMFSIPSTQLTNKQARLLIEKLDKDSLEAELIRKLAKRWAWSDGKEDTYGATISLVAFGKEFRDRPQAALQDIVESVLGKQWDNLEEIFAEADLTALRAALERVYVKAEEIRQADAAMSTDQTTETLLASIDRLIQLQTAQNGSAGEDNEIGNIYRQWGVSRRFSVDQLVSLRANIELLSDLLQENAEAPEIESVVRVIEDLEASIGLDAGFFVNIVDQTINPSQEKGISKDARVDAAITADSLNYRSLSNVPSTFDEIFRGDDRLYLDVKDIQIVQLSGDPAAAEKLLSNPETEFTVSTSVAQSLGSIVFAGQGKGIKEVADGNAVYMTEENIKAYIARHPKKAIVVLADEGERDGSFSLRMARIYWSGYEQGFKDPYATIDGTEVFDSNLYNEALDQLRKQGVEISYYSGDALEHTNGLYREGADKEPSDSWALAALRDDDRTSQRRPYNDTFFRKAGISFNNPNGDAGIQPFDLPSVVVQKLAKSKNIVEGTQAFEDFVNSIDITVLGPRSEKDKKENEGHKHGRIIADAKELQKKYPGLKVLTPGDGDFTSRLFSALGVKFDGRERITFGRSGMAESTIAEQVADMVPGGYFVNRFVSKSGTENDLTEENADKYSEAENAKFRQLGFSAEDQRRVRSRSFKGNGITAASAVTGASKWLFGDSISQVMKRVNFNETDDTVEVSTVLTTPEGIFLLKTNFKATRPLMMVRSRIATASPAAVEYAMDHAMIATEPSAVEQIVVSMIQNLLTEKSSTDEFYAEVDGEKISSGSLARMRSNPVFLVNYAKGVLASVLAKQPGTQNFQPQQITLNNNVIRVKTVNEVSTDGFRVSNSLDGIDSAVEQAIQAAAQNFAGKDEQGKFYRRHTSTMRDFQIIFNGISVVGQEGLIKNAQGETLQDNTRVYIDDYRVGLGYLTGFGKKAKDHIAKKLKDKNARLYIFTDNGVVDIRTRDDQGESAAMFFSNQPLFVYVNKNQMTFQDRSGKNTDIIVSFNPMVSAGLYLNILFQKLKEDGRDFSTPEAFQDLPNIVSALNPTEVLDQWDAASLAFPISAADIKGYEEKINRDPLRLRVFGEVDELKSALKGFVEINGDLESLSVRVLNQDRRADVLKLLGHNSFQNPNLSNIPTDVNKWALAIYQKIVNPDAAMVVQLIDYILGFMTEDAHLLPKLEEIAASDSPDKREAMNYLTLLTNGRKHLEDIRAMIQGRLERSEITSEEELRQLIDDPIRLMWTSRVPTEFGLIKGLEMSFAEKIGSQVARKIYIALSHANWIIGHSDVTIDDLVNTKQKSTTPDAAMTSGDLFSKSELQKLRSFFNRMNEIGKQRAREAQQSDIRQAYESVNNEMIAYLDELLKTKMNMQETAIGSLIQQRRELLDQGKPTKQSAVDKLKYLDDAIYEQIRLLFFTDDLTPEQAARLIASYVNGLMEQGVLSLEEAKRRTATLNEMYKYLMEDPRDQERQDVFLQEAQRVGIELNGLATLRYASLLRERTFQPLGEDTGLLKQALIGEDPDAAMTSKDKFISLDVPPYLTFNQTAKRFEFLRDKRGLPSFINISGLSNPNRILIRLSTNKGVRTLYLFDVVNFTYIGGELYFHTVTPRENTSHYYRLSISKRDLSFAITRLEVQNLSREIRSEFKVPDETEQAKKPSKRKPYLTIEEALNRFEALKLVQRIPNELNISSTKDGHIDVGYNDDSGREFEYIYDVVQYTYHEGTFYFKSIPRDSKKAKYSKVVFMSNMDQKLNVYEDLDLQELPSDVRAEFSLDFETITAGLNKSILGVSRDASLPITIDTINQAANELVGLAKSILELDRTQDATVKRMMVHANDAYRQAQSKPQSMPILRQTLNVFDRAFLRMEGLSEKILKIKRDRAMLGQQSGADIKTDAAMTGNTRREFLQKLAIAAGVTIGAGALSNLAIVTARNAQRLFDEREALLKDVRADIDQLKADYEYFLDVTRTDDSAVELLKAFKSTNSSREDVTKAYQDLRDRTTNYLAAAKLVRVYLAADRLGREDIKMKYDFFERLGAENAAEAVNILITHEMKNPQDLQAIIIDFMDETGNVAVAVKLAGAYLDSGSTDRQRVINAYNDFYAIEGANDEIAADLTRLSFTKGLSPGAVRFQFQELVKTMSPSVAVKFAGLYLKVDAVEQKKLALIHIELAGFTTSENAADLVPYVFMPKATAVEAPGGIDFNADHLNLKEQGEQVNFDFSNTDLQNLQPNMINGLQPVIINITPLTTILPLLGYDAKTKIFQSAKL